MERGVNYIIIGLCFLASIIGLIVFIFWFSNTNIFGDNMKIYKAYTNQSLNIKIDSPIKHRGISVGRVVDIGFKDNKFEEIEITLKIDEKLPVKKDSTLEVEQNGILGDNYLSLIQNDKTKEIIQNDGETLNIKPNNMAQVLGDIPNITGKIDDLVSNANDIINLKNSNSIALILESIKEASININSVIKSIQENTTEIDSILKTVTTLTVNANSTVEIINNKLQSGEFDFKNTLTPVLISLEETLNNLNEVTKKGEGLLNDFKNSPYDTIFGYRK